MDSVNKYGNKYLHKANKAKEDEFYTQLADIERGLIKIAKAKDGAFGKYFGKHTG